MLKLHVIIGSTRPGRQGEKVGKWFYEIAEQHPEFETKYIDLAEVNLPLLDEPNHPAMQQYTHEHTKQWSKTIAEADAYVIVTPEYNHGPSAALKNALDYVYNEWANKPVAFVSYGGVAAGARSVEQLRLSSVELHMAPVREAVHIPFITQAFDENGGLKDQKMHTDGAKKLLGDLAWWGNALKTARQAELEPVTT